MGRVGPLHPQNDAVLRLGGKGQNDSVLQVSVAEPVAGAGHRTRWLERYTGGGCDMGGAASVGWSKVPRCGAPRHIFLCLLACLTFFSFPFFLYGFIWPCSFLCFVEETLVGLSIGGEEEAATIPDGGVSYEHCFVGSFLKSSVINSPSMKVTLANVWYPIGGISISDLNEGRYLFRLYYKVDVDRIEAGGPWTFNSHLLVMHCLWGREDPMVPLVTIDF
ncbi:hypothetical protein PVK06_021562 [Gossypium arboreum]|uniref:DUF4283 domain-containing protein n=1 Tax=Gossypium arboreum TaxID=29729 RepID=A0ABR0PQC8_GOSAR|nr:hypothetical protein PVK06_021562 [Gossypium arboreum]